MPKQQAIAENFHPDLELGNLEPFQLSFAYNGGVMIWKRSYGYQIFILFVKYVVYDWG